MGELRAVVGKPFRVICPAAGYPLEKVTWTKGELVGVEIFCGVIVDNLAD